MYVYKRIEDLNNDWEKRSRQIHTVYEKAMKDFTEKYLNEIEEKDKSIQQIKEKIGYEWRNKVFNLTEHAERLERDLETNKHENDSLHQDVADYMEQLRE